MIALWIYIGGMVAVTGVLLLQDFDKPAQTLLASMLWPLAIPFYIYTIASDEIESAIWRRRRRRKP